LGSTATSVQVFKMAGSSLVHVP